MQRRGPGTNSEHIWIYFTVNRLCFLYLIALLLCCAPSFMPSTLHALFDLNPIWGIYSHCPYFADEETEVQRV